MTTTRKWKAIRMMVPPVGIAWALGACAGPALQTKPLFTPKFDFAPPEQATARADPITIAIVAAAFEVETQQTPLGAVGPKQPTKGVVKQFVDAMAADFQEMISARGFRATGPFENLDALTFPDKKNAPLVLVPKIKVTIEEQDTGSDMHVPFGGSAYSTYRGNVVVSGRVDLLLLESVTGTQMWRKSVAVAAKAAPYADARSTSGYGEQEIGWFCTEEPVLIDACARTLTEAYAEVFATAWKYLDPEEVAMVNRQAEEIRSKTRF